MEDREYPYVETVSLNTSVEKKQEKAVEQMDRESGRLPDAPYFMVKNLIFQEELDYFTAEEGLPVYLITPEEFLYVGKMPPTLDAICRADFLDTDISFVSSTGESLDLKQPESLYRFITVKGGGGSQLRFLRNCSSM